MALLSGKVALVTGAGGGLGRCHALALAKEGAQLVVNDLGGARDGSGGGAHSMADKVVDEIKALGGKAVANYDSVATVKGGEGMVKAAVDAFGKLDICVNNAGILRDKTLAKLTEDLWDPVVDVHLKGTYCVTRPAYNHMRERGQGGVIINTSSTSGLNGNFGQTNYGAAKAGIWGFSRCLAIEGQKAGIRVYILAPVAPPASRRTRRHGRRGRSSIRPVSPLVVYSSDREGVTGRRSSSAAGDRGDAHGHAEGVSKRKPAAWTPRRSPRR
jgi:NAD(P)-dependent dehydrogenase (short-subunit alcohol dehydrogenase family)